MSLIVDLPGGPIGAKIRGVDIAAGVDEATFLQIRRLLDDRAVVVIRGQRLTPQQQVDFCGRFGSFEPHVLPKYLVPGHPELICISNLVDENGEPVGLTDAGRVWHTDGHFDERPNLYSMLYSLEIPRDEHGRSLGATWFAGTAAAYDRLDDQLKRRLEGMTANNSLAAVFDALRKRQPDLKRPALTDPRQIDGVDHPVIRTHPRTGRKCIYVTAAATRRINGIPEPEGREIIERLQAICIADDLIYKHAWDVGDLLIWDNCAILVSRPVALDVPQIIHQATAELVWSLILGLTRHTVENQLAMRSGGWQTHLGFTLAGKTLGVIGLGRVGALVARTGSALGMKVLAWSPRLTRERAAAWGAESASFEQVLAEAHVVTLHANATDDSAGLIGRTQFARMRRGAYFVNTARAALVEEQALREALDSGALAGVGLDVYWEEPLPREHWLRRHPKVLMQPHMGGFTPEGYAWLLEPAVENVLAYLDGAPKDIANPEVLAAGLGRREPD